MEHKAECEIEYETCMRDNGEITISDGQINIEYGKISFVKGGKEYNLNRVMKRKAPDQIFFGYSYQNVPKGVVINGQTLLYPDDFLQSDEIDWDETVVYRSIKEGQEAKRQRDAVARETERQQREHAREAERQQREHAREAERKRREHAKEKEKEKKEEKEKEAKLQRDKHARGAELQRRMLAVLAEEKGRQQNNSSGEGEGNVVATGNTRQYIDGSADDNVSNPSARTDTVYPKLGGRDFPKYGGMDMNRIISECTTDQQRAEVLKLWDIGYRSVSTSLIPKSVTYGPYEFIQDSKDGKITVKQRF
jgi:hypothetical protein